jgi:hypothetical protein
MVRIVGLVALVSMVVVGTAQAQDRRVGFERIRAQWDEPFSVQRLEVLADGVARLETHKDGERPSRLVGRVSPTLLAAIDDARMALAVRGQLSVSYGRRPGSTRGIRIQTTHPGQPGVILEGGLETWLLRRTDAQERYLKLLAQVRTSVLWSDAPSGERTGGMLGGVAPSPGGRTTSATGDRPRGAPAPGVHVARRRRG